MTIRTTFSRGQIGPSLKGRLYSYTREGVEITAAWPKKRPQKLTVHQEQAIRLFKETCVAMKNCAWQFIYYAREDSKGTPMLPRDALMAAIGGGGPIIVFPDGRKLYPMAASVNLSEMLDLITPVNGSIMVRWADYWVGLNPPSDVSILAYDPATGPYWTDPPEGTSTKVWFMPPRGGVQTEDWGCKGNKIWPTEDLIIDAIGTVNSIPAGLPWNFTCYEVDGSNDITAIVYDVPMPLTSGTGERYTRLILEPAMVLNAGKTYWLAVRAPGASNTYNIPIHTGPKTPVVIDIEPYVVSALVANSNPVVGNRLTEIGIESVFDIGIRVG